MPGEIKALMVTLLLISIVIIGCGMFVGSVGDHYGVTGVDNITQFSSASKAQQMSSDMRDSIKNAKLTNVPALDIPFMIISGGYNALMLAFNSVDYFATLISDLAGFSGLPIGWVVVILTSLVCMWISFGILSALLKWEL